jgi:tetraacyldisaccharide 4'-kinase
MVSVDARATIRAAVCRRAPAATWCELVHAPRTLVNAGGTGKPLNVLAGRRLAAFCGIGNPSGFWHTLRQCGYRVVAMREFADHHAYLATDLKSLARWAADAGAEAVVCTQKDLVKIDSDWRGSVPLWAVSIELELVTGREALEAQLTQLLPDTDLPRPD